MASSGESLQVRLGKFPLAYRNAPHAFTGELPAVRLMGRQLRTRLDSVKPDNRRENKRLEKQMERGYQNLRSFREGDMAWVRDYHGKDKWVPGTINKKCGPLNETIFYFLLRNLSCCQTSFETRDLLLIYQYQPESRHA